MLASLLHLNGAAMPTQQRHSMCKVLLLAFYMNSIAAISNSRLPTVNETSCWTYEDPPSCQVPDDHYINPNISIQQECAFLDNWNLWYYDVVWEFDLHVEGLADIQVNTSECEYGRQVYHLCYWCLPRTDPDFARRYEFCYLEGDICSVPDEITLSDAEINQTCDELATVLYDDEAWPAELDLCKRAEAAVYGCDYYCRNGERNPEFYGQLPTNESCWTLEDPPDCQADTSTDFDDEDLDLQAECRILWDLMFDGWYTANLWTHPYALASIPADSDNCTRARRVYPHCAFCHPAAVGNEDFCDLESVCSDAGARKPVVKDPAVNMRAACEELEQAMEVKGLPRPYTADLCYKAEMSLHACEFWCSSPYLGADTSQQKWTLVWLARSSALLSFLGACFVLWDVLSVRKNRKTVYHQLLAAMAVFDIVTATAWSFSTAPLPVDEAWKIVGATGNDMTCMSQAFFIQLGFTSVFYNTSLAAYYVLVIVRRWREDDLKRIRWLMHTGPLVVGCALAFAIVPFADWTGYGCHIVPPPDDDRWKSLVFVVVPLGISVVAITTSMGYMYLVVRQNAQASRKWSFGVGSRRNLETQVFWQSLLYTLSFYVTWPIMFAVYLGSVDYKANSFALTATVSFVAPLQGFSNSAVYIRPKILRYLKVKIKGLTTTFSSRISGHSSVMIDGESRNLDPSAAIATRRRRRRRRSSWLRYLQNSKDKTSDSSGPERATPVDVAVSDDDDDSGDASFDDMDPSARIAQQPIIDANRSVPTILVQQPNVRLATNMEEDEEKDSGHLVKTIRSGGQPPSAAIEDSDGDNDNDDGDGGSDAFEAMGSLAFRESSSDVDKTHYTMDDYHPPGAVG